MWSLLEGVMGFLIGGWASSALDVAEFLVRCIFIVQAELCEDLFVLGLNSPESEYDQLKPIPFLMYYYIFIFLIMCFLFVFLFHFSIHILISFGPSCFCSIALGLQIFLDMKLCILKLICQGKAHLEKMNEQFVSVLVVHTSIYNSWRQRKVEKSVFLCMLFYLVPGIKSLCLVLSERQWQDVYPREKMENVRWIISI